MKAPCPMEAEEARRTSLLEILDAESARAGVATRFMPLYGRVFTALIGLLLGVFATLLACALLLMVMRAL